MPRISRGPGGLIIVMAVLCLGLFAGLLLAAPAGSAATAGAAPAAQVDRGRYLVKIAGCNDCHTPRYAEAEGEVPESTWLIGDALGWYGPWGTTYPPDLRALLTAMTEDDWVKFVRELKTRPPMPWYNLRAMTDDDLRAIYVFVVALGPSENKIPAGLAPGVQPAEPYVLFPGVAPVAVPVPTKGGQGK